jgi:hypothetical protein
MRSLNERAASAAAAAAAGQPTPPSVWAPHGSGNGQPMVASYAPTYVQSAPHHPAAAYQSPVLSMPYPSASAPYAPPPAYAASISGVSGGMFVSPSSLARACLQCGFIPDDGSREVGTFCTSCGAQRQQRKQDSQPAHEQADNATTVTEGGTGVVCVHPMAAVGLQGKIGQWCT